VASNLVIFASGRGSNAQAIIDYFRPTAGASVTLIVTNKADAGVLDIAEHENIPAVIVKKAQLETPEFIESLRAQQPALIVLAGFLLKIPEALIAAFPGRIVNIHPALLPAYGGKGMWGHHVHDAVIASGDTQSGITVHLVDEEYDHGATLLQARCPVLTDDTADTLAARIHGLEHFYFPRAIEFLLSQIAPPKQF
jgi:phosphoribosylglycinamide formyltransferase-1